MLKRFLPAIFAAIIALFTANAPANAAVLRVEQDEFGPYIGYYGPVEANDSIRLLQLVQYHQGLYRIKMSSPGGDAIEGYRLGETIRLYGLQTIVPSGAYCLSACATAFAGGAAYEIKGYLGYHVAWTSAWEMPAIIAMMGGQQINSRGFNYYAKMGFNIDFMTIISNLTTPATFFTFDNTEDFLVFRKYTAAGIIGPSGIDFDEEYFEKHLMEGATITDLTIDQRRADRGIPPQEKVDE